MCRQFVLYEQIALALLYTRQKFHAFNEVAEGFCYKENRIGMIGETPARWTG